MRRALPRSVVPERVAAGRWKLVRLALPRVAVLRRVLPRSVVPERAPEIWRKRDSRALS
ncbi:hypothetical protein ABZ342_47685 [Amycolatopsis sp. NPDC005961]|uniref:hypothetical protein n=1 Tax=Amycolatopsis sp. NPDC005961 TaxID=3156720 RepID=UPI0033E0AA27